jgi:hypothetical protein
MRLGCGAVGILPQSVVARTKVPSLAVVQGAHEATTEDEEGYVEGVDRFAQLFTTRSALQG